MSPSIPLRPSPQSLQAFKRIYTVALTVAGWWGGTNGDKYGSGVSSPPYVTGDGHPKWLFAPLAYRQQGGETWLGPCKRE